MLEFIQNNILFMDLAMRPRSLDAILVKTWPIIVVIGSLIVTGIVIFITINKQRKDNEK